VKAREDRADHRSRPGACPPGSAADRPEVRAIQSLQATAGNAAVARLLVGRQLATRRQTTAQAPAKVKPNAPPVSAQKAKLDAQVAEFRAELERRVLGYLTLREAHKLTTQRQNSVLPGAGQHVHMALAYELIRHNPKAFLRSFNANVVGVDVTAVPKLAKLDYGRKHSLFSTGPGTIWFINSAIQLDETTSYSGKYHREFLIMRAGVPAEEVSAILDPWYRRVAKRMDRSLDKGPPLAVQFIAEMNPLTSVAKIIEIISSGKVLLTGEKATPMDVLDAALGLMGGMEAVYGDFVKSAVAQTVTKSATGKLADAVAKQLTKDEALQEAFGQIIETAVDMALSKAAEKNKEPPPPAPTKPPAKRETRVKF
jgi:hypothetical protein